MKLILILFALSLAACKYHCDPSKGPQTLEQFGVAPPGVEKVIAAAAIECGHPIVGEVHWMDTVYMCGYKDGQVGKYSGCQLGYCWLNAQVLYSPNGTHHNTLYRTALAHEIAHWCFPDFSEAECDAFATRVHERAQGL